MLSPFVFNMQQCASVEKCKEGDKRKINRKEISKNANGGKENRPLPGSKRDVSAAPGVYVWPTKRTELKDISMMCVVK